MESWLQSLIPWGTQVIIWVQSHVPPWVTTISKGFTFLGYQDFYFVALPLLYWCVHKQLGAALVYLSLLSAWVNDTVKYIFRLPRPSDPAIHVPPGYVETNPSFPSGHAQNSVVNWGYTTIRLRNRIFSIVAVLVILGISLSRIVLGVHFPEDIVGGWIIGLILLGLYVWAGPPLSRWVVSQTLPVQIGLAVVVPLALIFVHPADNQGLYPAKDSVVPMSTLIGIGVGLIMERAWIRFAVEGAWWQRGLRLVVGLAVLGVFYLGPSLVVPAGLAYGPETLIRFVRYAVLGWIAAFLCPWLFVRLRLAGQDGAVQGLGDRSRQ
jgi:membrane-associated phospholipid phosphatase